MLGYGSRAYQFKFSPSTQSVLSGFLALFPNLKYIHFTVHPGKLEGILSEQAFSELDACRCPTIQVSRLKPHNLFSLKES
jgi:hypothetical protein